MPSSAVEPPSSAEEEVWEDLWEVRPCSNENLICMCVLLSVSTNVVRVRVRVRVVTTELTTTRAFLGLPPNNNTADHGVLPLLEYHVCDAHVHVHSWCRVEQAASSMI